jgi:hypothetical protein
MRCAKTVVSDDTLPVIQDALAVVQQGDGVRR